MKSQILPTKSEIYRYKNQQKDQNCIKMNIYGPAPMNDIENQEQSNRDINQTGEALVTNNTNQLSLNIVEDNKYNYPLSENRNKKPALIILEKKVIIYNSVNPNMDYMKKEIIMDKHQKIGNIVVTVNQNINYMKNDIISGNQQSVENNSITLPIKNNFKEEINEETECDDVCCCILKIICFLMFFPLIIIFYCLILICYCETKDDKDLACIHCCLNEICFKKKKRR